MFRLIDVSAPVGRPLQGYSDALRANLRAYLVPVVVAYAPAQCRRNAVQLWRRLTLRTHRTRLPHFLLGATWPARDILHTYVRDVLMEMEPGPGEMLYWMLDETRLTKRGKQVARADWYFDAVTGRKQRAQLVLVATAWFRGFIFPWDFFVHAKWGTVPVAEFEKPTDAAARMVREFVAPSAMRVVVLFDRCYLCNTVVRAVRERGWLYVSRAKENRNVFVGRRKSKAGARAKRALCNGRGRKVCLGQHRYRFVQEDADTKGLGRVRLAYSRLTSRLGKRKIFVSNDLSHSGETILCHYYRRRSIEVLIKESKQILGLGDCSSSRSDASVTHLLVVGLAAALLTRRDLRACGVQGKKARGSLFARSCLRMLQETLRHDVITHHLHRILAAPTSRKAKQTLRSWTELEAA